MTRCEPACKVPPQPDHVHERRTVFGESVRERRVAAGLTQEELAERAAIHRTYLSDVERGGRNLSLVNVEKLSAALKLPLAELFRRVEAFV